MHRELEPAVATATAHPRLWHSVSGYPCPHPRRLSEGHQPAILATYPCSPPLSLSSSPNLGCAATPLLLLSHLRSCSQAAQFCITHCGTVGRFSPAWASVSPSVNRSNRTYLPGLWG